MCHQRDAHISVSQREIIGTSREDDDLKGLLVWYGGARTERNLWIVLVIGMEHQPANVYLLLLVWEISKLDFSDAFQLPQIN